MNYLELMRSAGCAGALVLGVGGALAQAAVTDASPPPAEERASTGAIVLENSLVRAQRERDFERVSTRTGVLSVGRGVMRETMKAQAQADLAQARAAQAAEFDRAGGMRGR